jgi:hypothetical protein
MASSAVDSEDDILMSDSDDATFHFNAPQIDPETFDLPIRPGQSQSNEWVILWLLKFQKRFNLPDIGFDLLSNSSVRCFNITTCKMPIAFQPQSSQRNLL